MSLVFLFGVMFVISVQPILMVSSLIVISFLYSLWVYKVMGVYWFGYVLLMVMLSGVLVVFTYMVTLIPNESFEIFSLIVMFMFMFVVMVGYKFDMMEDVSFVTLNLWMTYLGLFNLFLVSFLLVMMLLVVFLSNMNEGSLRVD